MSLSLAQRLAALPKAQRDDVLGGLSAEQLAGLSYVWKVWAHPAQLPPPGDWRAWLFLGGRGSGKTRAASEWVRDAVSSGLRRQIGIIGPTWEALRRVQIEGPSGILAVSPPGERPTYEMTQGRLTWPNGAQAHLFSAEEPDRLRGPNLDAVWLDELCSMLTATRVWDMANMACRIPGLGGRPAQLVITTTPQRNTPVLRSILDAPNTVLTKARTLDNRANLDAATVTHLLYQYGGTALGRQELDAEILDDVEEALWKRQVLDSTRLPANHAPARTRVVIAVDPSGGSSSGNAETGIIVACRDPQGHAYVLQDASGRLPPERWAARVVALYEQYRADCIIAEQNFGGAMVESTISTFSSLLHVKLVHASRGKAIRAEPIAVLYGHGRVHHVGVFPALEDQLCQWVPGGGGPSPDGLDALVWAITELLLDRKDLDVWHKLSKADTSEQRFGYDRPGYVDY